MDREKVVERVLSTLRVSELQLDSVGKLLELEGDDRVHSVGLFDSPSRYDRFWMEVSLLRDFADVGEFRKYLAAHDLPQGQSWKRDGMYLLTNSGVHAQFCVPEFYPKK